MTSLTSVGIRLTPEDKARLREIKRRTAVIETLLLGRDSDGKSVPDVLRKGMEACEAEIARTWTKKHQALLEAGDSSLAAGLVAEAREQGFGPDTPQDAKIAKAAELAAAGVPESMIAGLFGVTQQRVSQWLKREAAKAAPVKDAGGDDRLGRARSRSKSAAPVRHATPVVAKFKAPAS